MFVIQIGSNNIIKQYGVVTYIETNKLQTETWHTRITNVILLLNAALIRSLQPGNEWSKRRVLRQPWLCGECAVVRKVCGDEQLLE
jgi:hypothetical protein